MVLKELPAYLRANRLPQNVSVDRVKLLEVSADGSLEELQELRQTAILGAEETRIWLHLGVDSGAKGFKLERSAWNEAAFRVPDERGWQPASQPISERHGSTSTCLRTRLPVRVHNVYRRVGRISRTPLLPASFAGARLQRNRALTAPRLGSADFSPLRGAPKTGLRSRCVGRPRAFCVQLDLLQLFVRMPREG